MANLETSDLYKRLDKALAIGGGTHSPADIWEAVKEGRMQAFQQNQSVVVTEVMGFPQKRVLNVVLAVGEMDDVLSLIPEMEEFGRQHGCEKMHMQGRKGWLKVLPKMGWTQPRVVLERLL